MAIGTSNDQKTQTRAKDNTNSNNPQHNPASLISENRQNYNTYPYDYYCGTNAKVFFGDVWVDDIVTIQYNVKQDKEPIYGYASQTYDAVARGVILVQGSFSIAFKEMGYLNVIQNLLETERSKVSTAFNNIITNVKGKAAAGTAKIEPALLSTEGSLSTGTQNSVTYASAGPGVGNGTPQLIRQSQTIEDILQKKKGGNAVASGLSFAMTGNTNNQEDFEDFAKMLEDTVWGDANGKPYDPSAVHFRRADEFDYSYDRKMNDTGGITIGRDPNTGLDDYSRGLNIMITFGDINDYRAEHTMVVLNDVHIVNSAMIIAPNGEPIAETYYFFARDINKALSKQTISTMADVKYKIGTADFSHNENIKAIGDWMDQSNQPYFKIVIKSIARYDTSWQDDTGLDGTVYAELNSRSLSRVDQLIQIVEQSVNAIDNNIMSGDFKTRFPKYSQWVLSVTVVNAAGQSETPRQAGDPPRSSDMLSINMVINQRIPNTFTYNVISPTRDNYSAVTSITRDALWEAGTEPTDVGDNNKNKDLAANNQNTSDPVLEHRASTGSTIDQQMAQMNAADLAKTNTSSVSSEIAATSAALDNLLPYDVNAEISSAAGMSSVGNVQDDTILASEPSVPVVSRGLENDLYPTANKVMELDTLNNIPAADRADFAALITVESNGNENAKSDKGAVGRAQLTDIAVQEVARLVPKYSNVTFKEVQNNAELNTAIGYEYYKLQLKTAAESPVTIEYARENNISIEAVAAGLYNKGPSLLNSIENNNVPLETRQEMGNFDATREYLRKNTPPQSSNFDISTPEGHLAYLKEINHPDISPYEQTAMVGTNTDVRSDANDGVSKVPVPDADSVGNERIKEMHSTVGLQTDPQSGSRYKLKPDGSIQWVTVTPKEGYVIDLIGPERYVWQADLTAKQGLGLAEGNIIDINNTTQHLTRTDLPRATIVEGNNTPNQVNNDYSRKANTFNDYYAPIGTPALATGPGKFVYMKMWDPVVGDYMGAPGVIREDGSTVVQYYHAQAAPGLKPGDRINTGDVIGTEIYTPRSSNGPHLHSQMSLPMNLTADERDAISNQVTREVYSNFYAQQNASAYIRKFQQQAGVRDTFSQYGD